MAGKPKCEDNLFCGVNKAKDAKAPTDLEKKHTPVIEAPGSVKAGECFQVTIEVGKLLAHPNERDHFIGVVDLYADDTYLGHMDFTPVSMCPKVTLCVSLDHSHGTLRAFAYCNMHGVWEGDKAISVG